VFVYDVINFRSEAAAPWRRLQSQLGAKLGLEKSAQLPLPLRAPALRPDLWLEVGPQHPVRIDY